MDTIGVITTGGTIGSVLSPGEITLDPTGASLRDVILGSGKSRHIETEVVSALNIHSEDMRPDHWSKIFTEIESFLAKGYTSIIITHGTDTLSYTSAIVALLFNKSSARICLTGAMRALEDPKSDAALNLAAAVRAVKCDEIPPGVYVAFRHRSDSDQRAAIIPALDLKPASFDDLVFEGAYDRSVASYVFKKSFTPTPFNMEGLYPVLGGTAPTGEALRDAARKVLMISAYPGLNLSLIEKLIDSLSAIVISAYHSGTAESGEMSEFVNRVRGRVPVVFATFPDGHLEAPYASTNRLLQSGGVFIKDLQPHVVYAAIVLGLAQGRSATDVLNLLRPWKL